MAKFMAIYYTPAEAMAQMANASEAQKMEGLKGWMKWQEKLGSMLVDMGCPMMPGIKTGDSNNWTGAQTLVSGYSIVEADSLDRAKELFVGHPHIGWHPQAEIHVHELMPM